MVMDNGRAIRRGDDAGRSMQGRRDGLDDQRVRMTCVRAPELIIGLVDFAVAVAIRTGERSEPSGSTRFSPEHVVGAIDNTVAVVVTRWQLDARYCFRQHVEIKVYVVIGRQRHAGRWSDVSGGCNR